MQTKMKHSELVIALENAGASDAQGEAYIILEELFDIKRSDILLNKEREYDASVLGGVIKQRESKIPLQYILGKWYFMGEEFIVSPDCLIPRPDTEILVYEAIRLLRHGGRVADLCTGSGCIGISMLKKRPDISAMTLCDISDKALNVASANAKALGVSEKCELALCDITKEIPHGKFDMLVSNPPYIPSADIESLSDEVKNEPHLALDGGDDGLDIVRALIDNAPNRLNEGAYLLVEFGYDQGNAIDSIMENALLQKKYRKYRILKDYGGNDRVLVAQK